MSEAWCQTYSGRAFRLLSPRAEDVEIVDIAHSLSMQCRYGGHCRSFFSIAEHSLLLSEAVPPRYALWALLHDAAEAYLVDVPRPVKGLLGGYRELEEGIMVAIVERFALRPRRIPAAVKEADARILVNESAVLMAPPPQAWDMPAEGLPGVSALIRCLSPYEAKRAFLRRFAALTGAEVTVDLIRGELAGVREKAG